MKESGEIQIKPCSQFEFVPQDTDETEFLGLVDFSSCVCIISGICRSVLCSTVPRSPAEKSLNFLTNTCLKNGGAL